MNIKQIIEDMGEGDPAQLPAEALMAMRVAVYTSAFGAARGGMREVGITDAKRKAEGAVADFNRMLEEQGVGCRDDQDQPPSFESPSESDEGDKDPETTEGEGGEE